MGMGFPGNTPRYSTQDSFVSEDLFSDRDRMVGGSLSPLGSDRLPCFPVLGKQGWQVLQIAPAQDFQVLRIVEIGDQEFLGAHGLDQAGKLFGT